MQYASLLSSAFSGSTLLSIILCQHPRVLGFGDTYPPFYFSGLDDIPCTCGKSVVACPIRAEINRRMRQRGFSRFDLNTVRPYPLRLRARRSVGKVSPGGEPLATTLAANTNINAREWFNILVTSNVGHLFRMVPPRLRPTLFRHFYAETAAFIDVLSELGAYNLYLDGSKFLPRFELLRTQLRGIKLIHLVKDPRSYMFSCLSNYKAGADHYPVFLRWLKHNEFIRRYENVLGPGQYLLVRYEDVVSNTESTVASILSFLNLPPVIELQNGLQLDRLHITGNPMIAHFMEVEDRSERWRSRLDPGIRESLTRRMERYEWISRLYLA